MNRLQPIIPTAFCVGSMSIPYVITYSGTNNQWYLVLRHKESEGVRRFAFYDESSLLAYYGFLLQCLDYRISNDDVREELEHLKESDESFHKREVGDYIIELERLPF